MTNETGMCLVTYHFAITIDCCLSRYGFAANLSQQQQHICQTVSDYNMYQPECGSMPNMMAALSNIGGALCSTPQSLADAHY